MLKLVIPTAGLGTRIGPYSKFKNKGLLTIGPLPAISHVIEAFPSIRDIVVILGYEGPALRDAIALLHPEKCITFVTVDNYSGPGSGLGHSLNSAREHLQCPFIFSPNDAILRSFPEHEFTGPLVGNVIGYYRKHPSDSYRLEDFRTIELDDGVVGKIYPKGNGTALIYTGIARIENYKEFWHGMDSELAIEAGEVIGLSALPILRGVELTAWDDCGTIQNLEQARARYKSNEYTILEKQDEAIWFRGERVIKFSIDPRFISGRLQRHKRLPAELVPKVTHIATYAYAYTKVEGQTLDGQRHLGNLINVLNTMQQEVWSHTDNETDPAFLNDLALYFYKEKTINRCRQYQMRYEDTDSPLSINGEPVPSLQEQLSCLNWESIASECVWANYHGDFHPDNIIVNQVGFSLIDWRQDFGNQFYVSGDVYYDLAKFMHGLEINHKIIADGGFSVHWKDKREVQIDVLQRMSLLHSKQVFMNWLISNNYCFKRVELLTSLIYLNIASLHEYPYAEFLHLFGRLKLNRNLINAL